MKTSEYPVSKTIPRRSTRTNAHHIIRKIILARNREIPELFERYMEQFGESEQWITVQEFRTCFQLDEMNAPAIAGFLRRMYNAHSVPAIIGSGKWKKLSWIYLSEGSSSDIS
jgi:hypothetical protein